MPEIEIVCLANSRKHRGRCIAGLMTDGSGWIRPVSRTRDGSLFSYHYVLNDGTATQVMDVIRLAVTRPRPEHHQPENWVIGSTKWHLVRRGVSVLDYRDLFRQYRVHGPDLLGNLLDRIDVNTFAQQPAKASLALIVVRTIEWNITTSFRDQRQTRTKFVLSGRMYDLVVTDPVWEQQLSSLPIGSTSVSKNVMLIVSLSEPFNGFCYKLVAAVIPF